MKNNIKSILKNKIIKTAASLSVILLFTYMTPKASAYELAVFQSGDWQYFNRGDYVAVCGYMGNEEHITIPSEIEGKEIREITLKNENSFIRAVDFFGNPRPENDEDFVETSVKRITFPDTVKRIGNNTFWNCRSLEQADLPQNLTAIGEKAFRQCEHLTQIEFPQSIKTIGAMAFQATSIAKPDLPEGLECIGDYAFSFSGITEAIIPNTVKYLGVGAFLDCMDLEQIKLPEGIQTLSDALFAGCSSLKTIDIPEGVSIIGEEAFGGCTSLEEIHFPKSVISVKSIFYKTSSLKDIYFEADKEYVYAFGSVWPDDDILQAGNRPDDDLMSLMVWYFDTETDYSGVNIHFGEKPGEEEEIPQMPKDPLRITLIILTAIFILALIITLFLYISQKLQNNRRIRKENTKQIFPIPEGNALTSFDSFKGMRCKKCGAENGEKADYCYNCGKKLSKSKRKET